MPIAYFIVGRHYQRTCHSQLVLSLYKRQKDTRIHMYVYVASAVAMMHTARRGIGHAICYFSCCSALLPDALLCNGSPPRSSSGCRMLRTRSSCTGAMKEQPWSNKKPSCRRVEARPPAPPLQVKA